MSNNFVPLEVESRQEGRSFGQVAFTEIALVDNNISTSADPQITARTIAIGNA